MARNGQRNEAALSCSQNMNSSGNLLVFTVHVFTREGGNGMTMNNCYRLENSLIFY